MYVDKAADLNMAVDIIENAKTSRPSVCNAEEVCLVHKDVAAGFLPLLKARLVDARAAAGLVSVDLRLDERAAAIIPGTPAGEQDFDTEFLNYILAIAVVDDVDAAIAHIARHSTHHSEAIITADDTAADRFTTCVDSAAVYVNASTRFTDGGEFGLGCEMGISTQSCMPAAPWAWPSCAATNISSTAPARPAAVPRQNCRIRVIDCSTGYNIRRRRS